MRKSILLYFTSIIILMCGCKKDDEQKLIRTYPYVSPRTPLIPQSSWHISSIPLSLPESNNFNDLSYGFNRAKICWYNIDPILNDSRNPLLPYNLTLDDISLDYVRLVMETEVFPNKDIPSGEPIFLSTLNIDFYPNIQGPYNFDTIPSLHSAGINEEGLLTDPSSRWGGISKYIKYQMHEFNYIEFWLMDPFLENDFLSGSLYINIGEISEEIMYDGFLQNEASLSNHPPEMDTSAWGVYGLTPPLAHSFSNTDYQDLGLDGLNDEQERLFLDHYLNSANAICSPAAYQNILEDPSKDNYHYFRGSDYDDANYSIKERYFP